MGDEPNKWRDSLFGRAVAIMGQAPLSKCGALDRRDCAGVTYRQRETTVVIHPIESVLRSTWGAAVPLLNLRIAFTYSGRVFVCVWNLL